MMVWKYLIDVCSNFLEFLSLEVFNEILLNIWYERIIKSVLVSFFVRYNNLVN